MASSIQLSFIEKENSLSLYLEGDLDQKSFLAVSNALSGRESAASIYVDLEKVGYTDSTGLRALVLLQRQARSSGAEFFLVHPSPSVDRILQTTGLSQIFQVIPTESASIPKDRAS